MWSRRDASLENSVVGNIFIKNLDNSIDNQALFDIFCSFGKILFCKVAQDEERRSKCHGCVQFETEEAAKNAISEINGMLLKGKKVYVCKFVPQKEREKQSVEKADAFTNVYIKNFSDNLDDENLRKMFDKYGKIKRAVEQQGQIIHPSGTPNQVEPPNQMRATLCCPAQQQIRPTAVACEPNTMDPQQDSLWDSEDEVPLDSEMPITVGVLQAHLSGLREEVLGAINSVMARLDSILQLVTSDNVIQSGFVPMQSAPFACPILHSTVVQDTTGGMHGNIAVGQQPGATAATASAQQLGQTFQPSGTGYFVTTMPQSQRGYFPPQMIQMTATPCWPAQHQIRPGVQSTAAAAARGVSGIAPTAVPSANPAGMPNATAGVAQQRATTYKYTANIRNQPQAVSVPQPAVHQAVHIQGQEPMLAEANPQEQKQMLGERLYPLIHRWYPELAGKITGMLLEIDNSELLHMLEHHEALKSKVEEAVAVLQAHQAKEALAVKKD